MKVNILESSGFNKLKEDRVRELNKAINKLKHLLSNINIFNEYITNNPVIHDSYKDFYVYKFTGHKCSIRLLYRYENDILEIHQMHFKKGDKDNSKYIKEFENYVDNYRR